MFTDETIKADYYAFCDQDDVWDSDKIERYASVSLSWRDKSTDEIITDGEECGDYRLSIDLNRLGEQMNENEYIDFVFNGNHMQINQAAKQHIIEDLI